MCVACGGTTPNPLPQEPPPIEKTVTWSWTPGTCHTMFMLYRVLPSGDRVPVAETPTTTYTQRMIPLHSTWVVSGKCDTGEYFSEPATLVP